MTQVTQDTKDSTAAPVKITAITPPDAAGAMAAACGRRVTAEQVRQVVEVGGLSRPDGTFSLIDYVAYLAGEVTGAAHD